MLRRFKHFFENFVYIQSCGELIKPKMNDEQLNFIQDIMSNNVVKDFTQKRQKGYSTVALAFCLYNMMHKDNIKIAYICDNNSMKIESFLKFRSLIKNIDDSIVPNGLEIKVTKLHNEVEFTNGSSIKFTNSSDLNGRIFDYIFVDNNYRNDLSNLFPLKLKKISEEVLDDSVSIYKVSWDTKLIIFRSYE